jgi:hypothetical protein
MPVVRKRRNADADKSPNGTSSSPRRQRRRAETESDLDDAVPSDRNIGTGGDVGHIDQMAKKLVRYALACEYSRQPIRRSEIGQIVTITSPKLFKSVFNEAQLQLEDVFGMKMSELPLKEKVTMQERRVAQKNESKVTSSKSWILVTTLPREFRDPMIIPPPNLPTTYTESSYVGLTSFIVALIYLSGGQISEAKLERHLRRTNADQSTPIDKTEKLLIRMAREGYILKVKEKPNNGDEAAVEYKVGTRGKVEIGEHGVTGMLGTIYNGLSEDLARRLERSLALGRQPDAPAEVKRDGNQKRRGRNPKDAHDALADEDEEGQETDSE